MNQHLFIKMSLLIYVYFFVFRFSQVMIMPNVSWAGGCYDTQGKGDGWALIRNVKVSQDKGELSLITTKGYLVRGSMICEHGEKR